MRSYVTGFVSLLIIYAQSIVPWLINALSYFLSLFQRRKAPKGLPYMDVAECVSSRCFRVSGCNPGPHTLQGTNTYVLGGGQVKAIIDTGESSTSYEWLINLEGVLLATKTKRVSDIFLTHGHFDHQGGVLALMEKLKQMGMLPLPRVHKRIVEGGQYPPKGFECLNIEDQQVYDLSSAPAQDEASKVTNKTVTSTLQAFYTPGHTDDSVCFVLQEDFALFSGDSVLGCGSSVFEDLADYMASLSRMRDLMLCAPCSSDSTSGGVPSVLSTIYPGHGPIIRKDALEKIDGYIAHREARETQIIESLLGAAQPLSSLDLVNLIYDDMRLNLILKISAQRSILNHLDKLKREKKVTVSWPDQWSWSSRDATS